MKITVWGLGKDSAPVVQMDGDLWRGPSGRELLPELPPQLEADADTEAVAVGVADDPSARVMLWPDRFVRAELLDRPEGVEVATLDAVIRIQRNRPWIG